MIGTSQGKSTNVEQKERPDAYWKSLNCLTLNGLTHCSLTLSPVCSTQAYCSRKSNLLRTINRVSRYFSTLLRISDATVSFRHPATRISAPSIGPVVNPNGILASIPEGPWCICASSWHRSPESCLEHRLVECWD